MKMTISGNRIILEIEKASEKSGTIPFILPKGYSIKSMMYHADTDNISLYDGAPSSTRIYPTDTVITFPVVNSKSPCFFILNTSNVNIGTKLCITITEFGCIPDTQYFAGTFLPLSTVNPDNGSEYYMIPSSQYER